MPKDLREDKMKNFMALKKGSLKSVILILVIVVIASGIFWFRSTETYESLKENPTYKKFSESSDKIYEYGRIEGGNILGFNQGLRIGNFLIGLLAGFWIWLGFLIVRGSNTSGGVFGDDLLEEEGEEIKDNPLRWVSFVAGRLWKVPMFAVVYWVLLHIPVINRIVEIVTLEVLGIGPWALSFVIALEVGYLPAILKKIIETKTENKYKRKAKSAAKGAVAASEMGKK